MDSVVLIVAIGAGWFVTSCALAVVMGRAISLRDHLGP